jgi:hypothetical protein
MEYNVTNLSKGEFLRLWDLVLIAREGIHIPKQSAALYRVSDNTGDFADWDPRAVSRFDLVGMYYYDGQIWLKSGEPFREMQDTVLHELAHHEVPHESHGRTWRKVFGTAYTLFLRESGYGWGEIHSILYTSVIVPYRIFRSITDPAEQRRIIRSEVRGIIRHAKHKIPILTGRG